MLSALDSFFQSLYTDDIKIDDANVLSMLATASMFLMDNIIVECSKVMVNTISWQNQNMIPYYDASTRYGVVTISRMVVMWLESNFLEIYKQYKISLKAFSSDLMTALVSSAVFTHLVGYELYPLLRTWLYFMMFPAYNKSDNSMDPSIPAAHYFSTRTEKLPFLLTETGCKFCNPFKAAIELRRFETGFYSSIRNDNIVPEEWFSRSS